MAAPQLPVLAARRLAGPVPPNVHPKCPRPGCTGRAVGFPEVVKSATPNIGRWYAKVRCTLFPSLEYV